MKELLFPIHNQQTKHDYVRRPLFVLQYARLANINTKLINDTDQVWAQRKNIMKKWPHGKGNFLSCIYRSRRIMFECSDFPELGKDDMGKYPDDVPIFKFHYDEEIYGGYRNVFPIGPSLILPSNIDGFNNYFSKRRYFEYTCSNDIVSNRQEPRRLALERRTKVQKLLKKKYKYNFDMDWKGTQEQFWEANRNCLTSVCVPGACNNMLDRGQYELIGLGVCTISPYIPTVLPWNKRLIPGEHYIQCKDDYTDLIDIIEWCRDNRDKCKKIGHNARELFTLYCTPAGYWQWIDDCMEKIN